MTAVDVYEFSPSQRSYLLDLDRVLGAWFDREGQTRLQDLVRAASGAFPTTVIERLVHLGISYSSPYRDSVLLDDAVPELHPLDFEWHFKAATAERLVEFVAGRGVTLIGLPSIARRLRTAFLLIERNPFVMMRNPDLLTVGQVVVTDVKDALAHDIPPQDLVIFDSPWYLGETLLWLSQAVSMVKAGGELAFSLFPRLLRPGAESETQVLLSYAESLGRVEVHTGALDYETPRFEAEALAASGTPTLNSWRRGDFVTIRVQDPTNSQLPLLATPLARESWRSYRIGRQVVKIRLTAPSTGDAEDLAPIESVSGWRYPSVSMRSSDRGDIDIWTSRNRVAKVSNLSGACQQLEMLQRAGRGARRRLEQSAQRGSQRARVWLDFLHLDDA